MEEYVIETLQVSEVQKHLNQWRHTYAIDVINTHMWPDGRMTIILKRTPKP